MRISPAGLKSGLPTTRFATPASSRRESFLGLRRRLAPQITPHLATHGEVPLLGALRPSSRRAEPAAVRQDISGGPVRPLLRRSTAITWSRPGKDAAARPRPRSAAPWRG